MIRFPAYFMFTKSMKFAQGAKSNFSCVEDNGFLAEEKPMTQNQSHRVYQ